ncbi:FAD-binding oxidoreductase [Nocardioides ferulae]|uniref:FAD-binding oxidoreductase n=1 Tax=Nocardioides ferulae TaxID=2340821 RepID=UPI000EACB306|nr:FAD-binding protein [Nocardioides ferulae]
MTTTPTTPTTPGTPGTPLDVARPATSLRGLCGGRVALPGDDGYDAARVAWNLAADQRPAAVAVPRSVEETAEVVRAAAAAGLRVAAQSTGHGASALAEADLSDTVLVRLHELTGVSVDVETRTARVVGGTLWADVVAAIAPHGLAALHGSAPDVAVAGYALGGGLSFFARQHGLAAHSITAAEVVTATGELVRADGAQNTELLHALRGGGGNLGVVVALEIALLPIADVYGGMLLWDRERAAEVVRAWTEWTRDLPESVTTSLRVMSFPPLPELPPFLSGRDLVIVDGAVLEDDDTAAALLAPLRALAPELDTFGRMPAAGMLGVHMDPPAPVPSVADHAVLGPLPDAAVDALLAEVGAGTRSGLMFAELRHLGGAVARPADGALSHVDGDYALFCVAVAPGPEAAVAGRAAAARVVEALAPWATGRHVLTFTERPVDPATAYSTDGLARLRAAKTAVDPTGVFVGNHRVS